MSEWLDLELAHRLGPVAAPDELWNRIENAQIAACPSGRRGLVLRFPRWRAVPVAAMATLALVGSAVWLGNIRQPALDIRRLAAAHPGPLDLQSADPAEIRTFLQRETGVDLPLRAASGVRLEGARVVRSGGRRMGAIEYRIGEDSAVLLVAHADPACPLPAHGGRVAFAVACSNPERTEAACGLCHASL